MKINLKVLDGTNEGLTKLCQQIAKKYWGLDFNIKCFYTYDIGKNTYGAYYYKYIRGTDVKRKVIGYTPDCIKVNAKLTEDFTKYQMLDLLKHEVCHWACQQQGKPHSDGSKHFESELMRIGGSSSGFNMRHDKEYKQKSLAYQKSVISKKVTRSKPNTVSGTIENLSIYMIYEDGRKVAYYDARLQDWDLKKENAKLVGAMGHKWFFRFTFDFNGEKHVGFIGQNEDGTWTIAQEDGWSSKRFFNEQTRQNIKLGRKEQNELKKKIIPDAENLLECLMLV